MMKITMLVLKARWRMQQASADSAYKLGIERYDQRLLDEAASLYAKMSATLEAIRILEESEATK